MSDTLFTMVQDGLKLEMVYLLIQLMLVAYIIIWIKSILINEFAWRKFKNNINIGKHSQIRLALSNGHIDGEIVDANRRVITVDTGDTFVFIPTKTFPDKVWTLVKMKTGV